MPTTRRQFLAGLGSAALASGQPRRRNVLMIAVDDLKPYLGCYGYTAAVSPNIDKLARRGLVFTRAYCQQAVCSPSRTSLLTGRRPDTTQVYELQTHFRKNLPDVVTLPQHFRNHGYQTSGFSKIFHGGLDDDLSWSTPSWTPNGPAWGTPENAARAAKRTEHLKSIGWKTPNDAPRQPGQKRGPSWESPDVADNALADGQTADAVIGALRAWAPQAKQDKPFFIGAGFLKPHLPFVAPKKYFDLYAKHKFTPADNPFPPKDGPAIALHSFGELRNYRDIPDEGPVADDKAVELIRAYHAALSYTDAQIGRVLDELDRLGLRDNTVVVLWGDHGWHLGDHGLWNKHSNFEQATRAPLIVSAPGQKNAGRQTAALTEFVDIYPSLAELAGLPKPEGVEGVSFAPLLDNPDRAWKKAAFSQYPRSAPGAGRLMGYTLRTERYRYTEWSLPEKNFHQVELYDYETDPKENVNLAASKPELVKRFAAMLKAGWRAAQP